MMEKVLSEMNHYRQPTPGHINATGDILQQAE